AIDSNDDIIVAGTINGDSGNLFIIKFNNKTKERIWNKTLSYNGSYSTPLTIDSLDNIYLAGIELNKLCLIKFDTNGTQQWIQKWEAGSLDKVLDITVDKNDNIYLVGRKHVDNDDFFIAKYTNLGVREWYVTWGGNYHDYGTSIGLDCSGYIYVTGYTRSYGNGGTDLCLLKLDPAGNIIFQRTWGSADDETGIALIVDSNCHIYIAGIMMTDTTPYDLVLLKFMNDGSLIWQKQWGDVSNDRCYDIALNSSGHVHVIGRSLYYDTWDSQIYVVGYDWNGTLVRQGFWNTPQEDEGHAIIFNSQDEMFIGGKTKQEDSTNWDMVLLCEISDL
ncbi:MAG: SBBP repeat-containing protein, partial [Candidatus Thorarchaeota archaeon]